MEPNPHIDSLFYLDVRDRHRDRKGLSLFIQDFAQTGKKFDLLIDLHSSFRSKFLSLNINALRKRRWNSDSFKRRLYVLFHYPFNIHPVTYRYLETLRNLIPHNEIKPVNYIHYSDPATSREIEETHPEIKDSILIIPGSQWFTKMYPAEYYIKLIRMFSNRNIFILGSESEKELCTMISSKTGATSLTGTFNLKQLTSAISLSKAVLTNDSGPMHISAGLGIPTVSFFGSTTRGLGFMPGHKNSIVIEDNTVPCRPCSLHGRKACPKGHFKCMYNLEPEKVFPIIQGWLNEKKDS